MAESVIKNRLQAVVRGVHAVHCRNDHCSHSVISKKPRLFMKKTIYPQNTPEMQNNI